MVGSEVAGLEMVFRFFITDHLMKIYTFNWWDHCKLVPTVMWTSHVIKTFEEWKGEVIIPK